MSWTKSTSGHRSRIAPGLTHGPDQVAPHPFTEGPTNHTSLGSPLIENPFPKIRSLTPPEAPTTHSLALQRSNGSSLKALSSAMLWTKGFSALTQRNARTSSVMIRTKKYRETSDGPAMLPLPMTLNRVLKAHWLP